MNTGRLRLLHLREQTEAVGETMATERERFAKLADPSAAPRAVSAFNLFQTPEHIADRMAAMLMPHLGPSAVVLEPSAGLGRLYRAMRKAGHTGRMVLADNAIDCVRELYNMTEGDRGVSLLRVDFLTATIGTVDAVIMNPPFKQGRDIKHIRRALSKLTPGGRLVSLCYNGPRQRAAFMDEAEHWEELPADSFKTEGTRASVALLVLAKPGDER